jgi:hypothetical protein
MGGYNKRMLKQLLRWLTPVVLGLLLTVPLYGQPPKKDGTVPPADLRGKDDSSSSTGSGHVPIFEFFLVIGGTATILFILCMPSRKR